MHERNPFALPSADLDEAPPEVTVRKPISVWMVQVVGAVSAIWAALGLALFASYAAPLRSVSRLGMPV